MHAQVLHSKKGQALLEGRQGMLLLLCEGTLAARGRELDAGVLPAAGGRLAAAQHAWHTAGANDMWCMSGKQCRYCT